MRTTDYFQESCGGKLCAKLVSLPIFLVHDCNKQYEATATATKNPIIEAAIAFESRKNSKNRKNNICLKFNICFMVFYCYASPRSSDEPSIDEKWNKTSKWSVTARRVWYFYLSGQVVGLSANCVNNFLQMPLSTVITRVWLNLRLIMQLIINGALHFAFFIVHFPHLQHHFSWAWISLYF